MTGKPLMMLALAAGLIATPLAAQGRLGLLAQGDYVCALPGSAAGAAWIEEPSRNFSITSASSYSTARGAGAYLLEGKSLQFTRGPLKGLHMRQLSSGLLQEVGKDGKLGRLRCHRAHRSAN